MAIGDETGRSKRAADEGLDRHAIVVFAWGMWLLVLGALALGVPVTSLGYQHQWEPPAGLEAPTERSAEPPRWEPPAVLDQSSRPVASR